MRALVFALALLASCAEMSRPPTFDQRAGGQPLVQEQAVAGLQSSGDAAVLELIDAEGKPPALSLQSFSRDGKPAKELLVAPPGVALDVAGELRQKGAQAAPLLLASVASRWPEALAQAKELGFAPQLPLIPEPGRRRWAVRGPGIPLSLRVSEVAGARAAALMLAERPGSTPSGEEVELARMPLWGDAIAADVWVAGRTAWMLAGSTGGGQGANLRRTIGVRRGSLSRGEAELHNAHGLADYSGGDLDAARREFARAISADPDYVDALYNAATVAALGNREDDAIALLHRAAAVDPKRVQVLGRDDEDLKILRRRAEVRGLLGLHRTSPADSEK